ncbi:MAG TPA: hypothetical protein VHC95_04200 [Opitutales bacterium]|nr:hypothetical protein [Opitutales bacterium]
MKPTTLALALAITGVSAWSCSKSSTPAADDKPAAPSSAPAAASAAPAPAAPTPAAPAPAPTTPKPIVATPAPVKPAVVAASPAPATPAPAATTGPDARLDIKTALPEAIKELEAKDYATFFKNFIPPSQVSQMPVPPEQMAAMISSVPGAADEFDKMLAALKQVQNLAPTIDPSGNKATFTLNPPIGEHKDISFVKENGMWYIGD